MKNKEKFKDEIVDFVANVDYNIGMAVYKKDNKIYSCGDMFCTACLFGDDHKTCAQIRKKWLDEQYKEPIIISGVEYVILNQINNYKYIARDGSGNLFLYKEKPNKHKHGKFWNEYEKALELDCFDSLFQFIKWEDEEPYNIKELIAEYYKNNYKK